MDIFTADADKLFLHAFGVVESLDPHLVIDAEDHQAAARVGESDDLLRYLLRVRELDLEFEEGVLAASDHSHQLCARSLRRWDRRDVFLKGTLRGRFVSLIAAEFSASHLCLDGACASRPDATPLATCHIAGINLLATEAQRHRESRKERTSF